MVVVVVVVDSKARLDEADQNQNVCDTITVIPPLNHKGMSRTSKKPTTIMKNIQTQNMTSITMMAVDTTMRLGTMRVTIKYILLIMLVDVVGIEEAPEVAVDFIGVGEDMVVVADTAMFLQVADTRPDVAIPSSLMRQPATQSLQK